MLNNRETTSSLGWALAKNMAFALGLVIVVNGAISLFVGTSNTGTTGGETIQAVPGWFIGAVWTALFAALGAARGVMEAIGSETAQRASRALLVLLLACAAYPIYTIGLKSDRIGLTGNLATIGIAIWAGYYVVIVRKLAVLAPVAVIGWLLFASLALVDQQGWLGSLIISLSFHMTM